MRRQILALTAALALCACGQGGIPGLSHPPANPPSVQKPQPRAQQADLTPAQKQQLEGLVHGYLDQVQQQYAEGFQPGAGMVDEITNLQPGADHRYQVNLTAGTAYRMIGVCDHECTNLDIELIDSTGSVVASDMLEDPIPVVNFTAPASGNTHYTVRMLMQACTVAPCYAAARILTGAPPPSGKPG